MFANSKIVLPGIVAFAVICGGVVVAVGQTQGPQPARVAIVNAQKAIADTAEMKKTTAGIQAKYQPRQQQIQTLQRDLDTIQRQLANPNTTPDQQSQLRATGTQKQKELQRLNEDLQSDFNNERQDVLGRAGRQMQQVLTKLAQDHGYDVVIEISSTLYYKPALDITPEATAAYDRAYPAH